MAIDWNQVYVQGDGANIQDANLINMYVHAMVARNINDASDIPFSLMGSGDIIQDVHVWRRLQDAIEAEVTHDPLGYGISPTSAWCEARDYTGVVDAFNNSTVSPTIVNFDYIKAKVLGGNTWTAKHVRRFTNLSSTTYEWTNTATDPNTFADGHYAECQADGRTYHRVTGAWVLAPLPTLPDIVTTYRGAERKDLFGPWLLNELRDAINLLEAFFEPIDFIDEAAAESVTHGSSSVSWADAKSKAETEFLAQTDTANAATDLNGSIGNYPNAVTEGTYSGSSWFAEIYRRKARATASSWSLGVDCTVDFYTFGGVPYFGAFGALGGPPVFENSGDKILEGQWSKFSTVNMAAGAADTPSAYLGSLAVPTWTADPTPGGSGTQTSNGYVATPGYGYAGPGTEGSGPICFRVFRLNLASITFPYQKPARNITAVTALGGTLISIDFSDVITCNGVITGAAFTVAGHNLANVVQTGPKQVHANVSGYSPVTGDGWAATTQLEWIDEPTLPGQSGLVV